MVKRGTEVQVLERGVPIARLTGIQPTLVGDAERIERLAKAGVLRRGSGDLAWVLSQPPITTAEAPNLAEALDADREDRF